MNNKSSLPLLIQAVGKLLIGLVVIAALLFLPAGTIRYGGAWLFIGLLFVPMLFVGAVLFIASPDLLRKRLNAKEKEEEQKTVTHASALMFFIGFVLAALDFRFCWSDVSSWVVWLASFLFLIGYVLYAVVLKQNQYLSRTIEVQEGQTVIDSGLYSVVRHPMYFATLLLFLPIPLILGSYYALVPFAVYPIVVVARIKNEEKLLLSSLKGYAEYQKKTRYKLIPFIW